MTKEINDGPKDLISLHVAGATVRHASPYSDLKVDENAEPLDNDFIATYVSPFYRGRKDTDEFRKKYVAVKSSIDTTLVSKLLGDFNWRPRSVGAYFAALGNMNELEDHIGKLLLRSDVCYAGHNYCLALASFSSLGAICYLEKYLGYYLEQSDLWFDQNSAMAALSYIGAKRGEDLVSPFMPSWQKFIVNKPNWDLAAANEKFIQQMSYLSEFKHAISS
ncbi:DUF6000 family protein [Rheinheimera sp.]|uniref:DUF6000 family protein n=1 Tax=Rheinheimera sp. TaxID=1869214 RepID=UPI0027331D55|nr:DUF6000 family protein [Rheinheimera sp.]MDP2713571.1 DUF6000 family protein [Rheinheimera sp.]